MSLTIRSSSSNQKPSMPKYNAFPILPIFLNPVNKVVVMVRSNCIRERKQVERRLEVELGSSPVTSLGVVLKVSSALLYDDLECFWTMDSLGARRCRGSRRTVTWRPPKGTSNWSSNGPSRTPHHSQYQVHDIHRLHTK